MGKIDFPKWLCECGKDSKKIDYDFTDHLESESHIAEFIGEDGNIKSILVMGIDEDKYNASNKPDSAQIKREKLKNEPLFDKTQ